MFFKIFSLLLARYIPITRLACKKSYYLPKPRTNYGVFNIRFKGTKIWNDISDEVKNTSLNRFKSKIKSDYVNSYQ